MLSRSSNSQDTAPSAINKYFSSSSAWQKWAEARDIKALPTSGPELVHLLLQTTKTLASNQEAVSGVARAHQKMCLPSSSEHTMVKQLLEACKRILGASPKNRETPLTAAQIKEVVHHFGRGISSELQIALLISLCFAAFLRWDDLQDLTCHNLSINGDYMSIALTKRKNVQFIERFP